MELSGRSVVPSGVTQLGDSAGAEGVGDAVEKDESRGRHDCLVLGRRPRGSGREAV
ncbi:conserved hypothetical protein [Nitrospira defluvii]|uniref:Uncharacterized protein n=1 Tax=Nitrospira defluvii TaxID=330214 RepID=A0ABN7L6X4_9BACT|nr:conserved hypothetical protein [Nitrospira defluvii]